MRTYTNVKDLGNLQQALNEAFEVKNNPYEYETRDLNIKAPVQKGTVIGELIIKKGGKEIGKVNIISSEEVKELSGFGKFLRFITFGWL